MPRFKPKANKKIKYDKNSNITVDNKHHELMNTYEKQEQLIPKLEKQIKTLKNKIHTKNYTSVEQRIQFQDTIYDLEKHIQQIKHNKLNYLLDNSKYIFDYFETKQNISKNDNKKKMFHSFFKTKEAEERRKEIDQNITNTKKYLSNVDESFIDIHDFIETHHETCHCGGTFVIVEHEGILVCDSCGRQTQYLIEHDKPSYKEPPKEVCFYAYKRINHFREILAQFQAKETTQIDDEILDNIRRQIKKERLSKDQLTNDKTKQILKNLGYNKYYEHIPFIKEKLGIKPPTMSLELENTLCNLFMEIQKPYAKFCPNERMNFLNYYYVLYKMCELLGHDEYLPHFYMLKDPVKRIEQDEIWKKICDELQWEFIPTP